MVRALAILILLLAGTAALWLLPAEFRAQKMARVSDFNMILELIDPAVPLPQPAALSYQVALLDRCVRVPQGLAAEVVPAAAREIAARKCLGLADRALVLAPTLSVAHLVRAVSLFRLADPAQAQAALVVSQLTAPREGWLAERRFDLGLRQFDLLDAGGKQALAADLGLLMSEPRYRPLVADRYLARPALADWIVGVVDTLPEADKAGFLAAVQQRATARGNG